MSPSVATCSPSAALSSAPGAPLLSSAAGENRTSLRGSCANLLLAVLGAGQLTLPYALSLAGLPLGLAILGALGLLATHSLAVLSFASHALRAESYSAVVVGALGPRGKHVTDLILVIYAWGGAVAFLIIVKEQLRAFFPSSPQVAFTAGCAMSFALALLRSMKPLRFTSYLGTGAALWVTTVVVLTAPWKASGGLALCRGGLDGSVLLAPTSAVHVGAAVPLIAFALNSSWGYLAVYSGMAERTAGRTAALIFLSQLAVLGNYSTMAAMGYLSYCGATKANIVDSLNIDDVSGWRHAVVTVARWALVVQLLLAVPLRVNVARGVFGGPDVPLLRHATVTAALFGSAFLVAVTSLPLQTVIGVTSAVCASMIIYILPSVVDLRLRGKIPPERRPVRAFAACVSIAVGLVVFAFGTYATLQHMGGGG